MPDNGSQSSNVSQTPALTSDVTGATPSLEDIKPAAAAQHTGFLYTPEDGVPDWAVGKTAKEVAVLAGQLYNELKRPGVTQPAPAPAPLAAPQPGYAPYNPQTQPAPVGPQQPTEDDWATDPRGAAQKQADYMRITQLDPVLNQQAEAAGQQSRAIMEMKDPEAFKRWGVEIDILINQVDPSMRSVDTISKIVGMVKANHLDEIVQERTKEAIERAQDAGTLRSGVAPDGTSLGTLTGVDFDKEDLPEKYRRILSRYGVTPDTLDEFLIATEVKGRGVSLVDARTQWLEKAKKGDILTEEAIRL